MDKIIVDKIITFFSISLTIFYFSNIIFNFSSKTYNTSKLMKDIDKLVEIGKIFLIFVFTSLFLLHVVLTELKQLLFVLKLVFILEWNNLLSGVFN